MPARVASKETVARKRRLKAAKQAREAAKIEDPPSHHTTCFQAFLDWVWGKKET